MAERKGKIPRFKNYEEEAAFWDAHSVTEFEEELEKVDLKFKRPLKHIFSISLDAKSLDELVDIAAAKGISFTDLARIWIMERLAEERGKSISATTSRSK